jgi:hypothetical protein
MLTTKQLGLDPEIADPKPVRKTNWLGNPIGPNESYYGNQLPNELPNESSVTGTVSTSKSRKQGKRRSTAWTKERRAAFAERVREYWRQRKQGNPRS